MDIRRLPSGTRCLVDANIFVYATEVEKLLRLPLGIIEVTPADILRSHALRLASGLFVNDSINLACAERHILTDIVTHDADFGRVPAIRLWGPTDV